MIIVEEKKNFITIIQKYVRTLPIKKAQLLQMPSKVISHCMRFDISIKTELHSNRFFNAFLNSTNPIENLWADIKRIFEVYRYNYLDYLQKFIDEGILKRRCVREGKFIVGKVL